MKKISMIMLALVVALGGLGVGYAMWSDTITISGSVNTGTLDLVVKEYSSTYVWKLDDHGIAVISNDDSMPAGAYDWDGPLVNGDTPTPVAYAEAVQGDGDANVEAEDDIHVTIVNAFPLEDANDDPIQIKADFLLHYEGSIPVRVQLAELNCNPDLSPFLNIMFYESDVNGGKAGPAIIPADLVGVQWHNCQYILVEIYFDSALMQAADWEGVDGAMGLSGDITGTIKVVQWNEYQ